MVADAWTSTFSLVVLPAVSALMAAWMTVAALVPELTTVLLLTRVAV